MKQYILSIPDELEPVIKSMGYDVKSWFQVSFLNPLLDKRRSQIQNNILDRKKDLINTEIKSVAQQVEFKQKKEEKEVPVVQNQNISAA